METVTKPRNNKLYLYSGIACVGFIFAAAVGFYTYSMICPCERTPGGILFGERINEPVSDWSHVNAVENCQLQIAAGIRPHSLTLNCWATPEGILFVGCMSCDNKYWGYQVEPNEKAYIRVAGRVYPVTVNRIEDPAEMDNVWRSRFYKLGLLSTEPVTEAPRAEGWWAFSVVSRPS